VLRPARLLCALHPTGGRSPLLSKDAGDPAGRAADLRDVLRRGRVVPALFEGGKADVDIVAERMRDAAGTMAALHALDPDALGLAGEPVVAPAMRSTGGAGGPKDEALIRIPRERRLAVLRASRDWFEAL
jgi:hypothetical protein